ncbi:unnamed protein product [Allacma fusca]|uniref:4-alpha-hydroxy-tetrahydropterin dehydratase n=1 Tax=Allacma fusca TaxID=39272 RepID=A0A8J2PHE9_9HEXA|nr:unnamed protein product [Allacma fusca]
MAKLCIQIMQPLFIMNQKKSKYTARKSTAGEPRFYNPKIHLFRLRATQISDLENEGIIICEVRNHSQNGLLPDVPQNNHPRANQRQSQLDLLDFGYHSSPTPLIAPVRVNQAQNEPGQISQSHNDPVRNVSGEAEASQNGQNGPLQAEAASNEQGLKTYFNLITSMSAELEPQNWTFLQNSGAKAIMQRLIGWNSVYPNKDTFSKEFVFKDIHQAWEFMCLVMVRLRRMTNHPDWRHVNNKVVVTLPSPPASCLTNEDSNLATFMDQIYDAIML